MNRGWLKVPNSCSSPPHYSESSLPARALNNNIALAPFYRTSTAFSCRAPGQKTGICFDDNYLNNNNNPKIIEMIISKIKYQSIVR
jgi:hypothetical protein